MTQIDSRSSKASHVPTWRRQSANLIVGKTPPQHGGKIAAGEADLVLAFDVLAAAAPDNLRRYAPSRTALVANTARIPTAQSIVDVSSSEPSLEALQEPEHGPAVARVLFEVGPVGCFRLLRPIRGE